MSSEELRAQAQQASSQIMIAGALSLSTLGTSNRLVIGGSCAERPSPHLFHRLWVSDNDGGPDTD